MPVIDWGAHEVLELSQKIQKGAPNQQLTLLLAEQKSAAGAACPFPGWLGSRYPVERDLMHNSCECTRIRR